MWLAYEALFLIRKLQNDINYLASRIGALSGGSGGGSGLAFSTGTGAPNGNVSGNPGDTYWDLDTDFEYRKVTGVGTNTGWMEH